MTKLKQTNHQICMGLARWCHWIGDACRLICFFGWMCTCACVSSQTISSSVLCWEMGVLTWTKGCCVSFRRVFRPNRLAVPPTSAWAFFWNGLCDCNPPKPKQHLLRASILQLMDPSKTSRLRQTNPQGALTRQTLCAGRTHAVDGPLSRFFEWFNRVCSFSVRSKSRLHFSNAVNSRVSAYGSQP